jgi:hypothetical protein
MYRATERLLMEQIGNKGNTPYSILFGKKQKKVKRLKNSYLARFICILNLF